MGFFRDPESCSPIPGIRDRDFLFLARSKNPGDRDRDLKIPIKSRKSQNPGDRDRDFKTSKKPRKKSRLQNPDNPEIPEICFIV